jgi:hypothetical protein
MAVNAAALIVVGAGLLLVSRLGRGSTGALPSGMWNDPPRWIRWLVGVERVPLDDALVALTGLLWLLGGACLAVTGQTKESAAFLVVTAVLVVCLIITSVLAFAIWYRREHR